MTPVLTDFGPEAKNKGDRAEAGRPKDSKMLNVLEGGAAAKRREPVKTGEVAKAEEEKRMKAWLDQRVAEGAREAQSEIVTLTPVLAQLLLDRNEANRPVSEVNLDRTKRDIAAGRWAFNGEAIIVSREGMLNDGQHRCRAVVETGRSIRVVIVFGPTRDTRFSLDQGVTRTVGHYLGMNGHADANALASASTFAWQYKQLGRISQHGRDRPTKSETLQFAEHYTDLADSLQFVTRNGAGAICTRSMLAMCHWAFAQASNRESADRFIDQLLSGAGLQKGNPILYCRSRLIEMKGRSSAAHDRAELIFRTWNAHRLDQYVERITLTGKKLPKLEK